MNELHLFAGGGGGILGGMLLGHRPVCAVEIEPYCRDILLQRQRDGILPWFPIWDDVRTFPGHEWRGRVDIVCGGFPCQDISVAGKGAGIDENAPGSGPKWSGSFAKWDRDTCSWKTPQLSLLGGLVEFSGTWPEWGSMRSGVVYRRPMPDLLTEENASGYLPTPSGTSNHGKNHVSGRLDEWGGSSNPFRESETGKLHCPRFEEWMMGWPDQWAALMPLEMDRFQQWLHSHGTFFPIPEISSPTDLAMKTH